MRNKKMKLFFIIAVVLGVSALLIARSKNTATNGEIIKEIKPSMGPITTYFSSTGTVLPKNRLEIKPPVPGRIDRVLVQEGEKVKTGQILAWMSSTERAALLDAARGKGDEVFKYWEEAYKPIPLPAPIDGEIIVATTQPGQTVTTADAVVVLSDRLIIRAQVDETDIGKVTPDKKAVISLDAYPDTKIKASVEHIYYESQTVNNVTIYNVDLAPEEMPPLLRSGMNASIDFISQSKENALLVPVEAISKDREGSYVLVRQDNAAEPIKRFITAGISDDKNVEVLSGISGADTLLVKTKRYSLPKSATGTNPFMPARKR